MKAFFFIVVSAGLALAQTDAHQDPYLLRVSHGTYDESSCALLQTNGTFHLEITREDDVKVYEGADSGEDLERVKQVLGGAELTNLSQRQIEEPLAPHSEERLQVTIFREDHWQDLLFQSDESEEPFKQSVQPLVHWLDNLHRLPHKEFSEDQGKQNCLPPREITLKKRGPEPRAIQSVASPSRAATIFDVPPLASLTPHRLGSIAPLLRAYSFSVKQDGAQQFCLLVVDDGEFRFESKTQRTGKPISTAIVGGKLDESELVELRTSLDRPELARIRHREPRSAGIVVPMLGDMLNLTITRPTGKQNIILSNSFGHEFGTFYGGDADISAAHDLSKFLRERIEAKPAMSVGGADRNDCTDAP